MNKTQVGYFNRVENVLHLISAHDVNRFFSLLFVFTLPRDINLLSRIAYKLQEKSLYCPEILKGNQLAGKKIYIPGGFVVRYVLVICQ